MTVSTIANCESIPNRNSIEKNNIDQTMETGIWDNPSGMTMNARPNGIQIKSTQQQQQMESQMN